MRIFKRFNLSLAVATVAMSIFSSSASADEPEMQPEIHVLQESLRRGTSAPSSNASSQDLSVSSYNYQIQKIGAQLYIDKWVTNATNMRVIVGNWHILNSYAGDKDKLMISVYSSAGLFYSKQLTGLKEGGSDYADFTGLAPSTKYYVVFSVYTNGNTYSFNGQIKKV